MTFVCVCVTSWVILGLLKVRHGVCVMCRGVERVLASWRDIMGHHGVGRHSGSLW
jgi:hypothetical protein